MLVSNKTNFSLWPCIHTIDFLPWSLSCTLCRIGGTIILLISIICFAFDLRCLFSQKSLNSLVGTLFTASLFVITISVPGVLVQLFTCHRHCFALFCRLEGFFSYLSGCLCVLVFMTLSIHRYLSLCSHHNLLSYRCSTILCWFLSLGFTLPLLFNYFNSYLPEGLGFHCSINWQDQSRMGRLYILSTFILMYFLPSVILLFVNVQAHLIVRRVYSKHDVISSFPQYIHRRSPTRRNRLTNDFQNNYVNKYCVKKAADRKRFRTDYRFLRAIVFLVSSYLIAWTPYSIVAILQLLNVQCIFQHAFLITVSAFVAKLSVIVTPFVYLSIMNNKAFKKFLFK